MPGNLRPNPLSPAPMEGAQQLMMKAPPVMMPGKGQPPSVQTQPQPQQPSSATAGLQQSLSSDNDRLQEQFDQLKSRDGTLSRVIVGMEKLVALGDTVTPKDVTERASGFVAAGLGPKAVAGVLAKMPVDSQEALANWCEEIFDSTVQMKQQLDQQLASVGHQLATNGMRLLLMSHVQDKQAQGQQPQPAEPPTAGAAAESMPQTTPEDSSSSAAPGA